MKIGMVIAVRNHPEDRYQLDQVYADYIEDALLAESELDLDHVWLNEHHLAPDEYGPSSLITLAAIAAQTERIRLGTGVCLLPFHNPIRVSEDAATVDLISRGRFELGVGIGSASYEYDTFGTPRADAWRRSWEAADLISRIFSEEVVDFDGEFYQYRGLRQTTKPAQEKVPMWWGGFGPQSMRRAAKRGYNLISNPSPIYDEACRATGRPVEEFEVGQVIGVHVAETRDKAWDEAENGIRWWMQYHRENTGAPAGMTPQGPLPELPPAAQLRNVEGLIFMPGMPLFVGTPDEVREGLMRSYSGEDGRVTQLVLAFRHAGMRTDVVRSSMELFRTDVLPHLPRSSG